MTNGFDKDVVLSALIGRVAFRASTDDNYPLSDDNTTSSTGLYFDNTHPLVTGKTIRDIQPEADISDGNFDTLIEGLREEAILSAVNAVISEPVLVDSGYLFNVEEEIDFTETIPNGQNFCGWRINVGKGDFAVRIIEAGLLFTQNKSFDLYLFNNLKSAPIETIPVNAVANDLTLVSIDKVLRDSKYMGGTYYLGYFQSDLGACKAIDPDVCYESHKVYSAYPFESVASGLDFDRKTISSSTRTYGLNLRISSYHDFTYRIKDNAHLFDELQRLTMASMVIEQCINSVRENNLTRKLDNPALQNLYAELNMGDQTEMNPRYPGVKKRLESEIKRVRREFFKKDPVSCSI